MCNRRNRQVIWYSYFETDVLGVWENKNDNKIKHIYYGQYDSVPESCHRGISDTSHAAGRVHSVSLAKPQDGRDRQELELLERM